MSYTTSAVALKQNKSRQVTAFAMGLGPSLLRRVVIPSNEFPFDESYCKGSYFFRISNNTIYFSNQRQPFADGTDTVRNLLLRAGTGMLPAVSIMAQLPDIDSGFA